MVRIEKTIFISYRRKDISWALAVYQDLTHNGYDVFFDYTSIPSGDFEQIIISNIKARAHFVLIMTPTTLDRCNEPGDWLRREIEKAIDEKRNIIPLFFDGFNFGAKNVSEKLTGKLKNVSRYNGMNVHHDYFQEAMERLRTKFLNVPLDTILHPISDEIREVVREEQLAANQALKTKPAPQPKSITETPKPLPVRQTKSQTFGDKLTFSNGMEFMCVPAAKFIMGSDNGHSDEKPQHTVDIPYDYWMGRYPVTNEQYNAYVTAKKIDHPVSNWEEKKDHPVVSVRWSDAMKYCEWLNQIQSSEFKNQNMEIRLPTEAEWERAARGTDGREFPWGNLFDINKCNTSSKFLSDLGWKFWWLLNILNVSEGSTTSVKKYSPQGDSPHGCADMAGNVWEWAHSEYKAYPYNAKDGREDEQGYKSRVLRGGSFVNYERLVRCASRLRDSSHSETSCVGFRVVVCDSVSHFS